MRSHKLLIVSATMLATTTLAGASFADNTSSGTSKSSTSETTPSSSTTTVTTPSAPPTSTTVTTGTGSTSTSGYGTMPSSGTMPPSGTIPPSSQPTSTTTTTSAEDVSAAAPTPPAMTTRPAGESTVVYQHHRPNTPLLITGGALLVGTYATTAAVSGANGSVADRDLYIPVVGPWINIADRNTNREDNTRDTLLIAGSGVLQGVGAALLITSFFVPDSVPAARISAGNVKMQVTPTASYGSAGVGAVGTF